MTSNKSTAPGVAERTTMAARRADGSTQRIDKAVLTIVYSADSSALGRRFVLFPDGDAVVIGRHVDSTGQILDPKMSRSHFRLVWDTGAGAFRYGDLNSFNGTRLNAHRRKTAVLRTGDVIRAGDTILVCEHASTRAIEQRARRAAASDLPVLVLGETGTGKERLAKLMHEASACQGKFVPVNCAAIPKELIAAELFGFVKGAFSGADAPRRGLFLEAEGGTLFLDEIGDLPLDVQPVLLRALQEKKIRQLGSDRELDVNARIIAATHQDLEAASRAGSFREDLYARLAQLVLNLPPLRERRTEVLDLVGAFAEDELEITADAAEALLIWDYPRNIRELEALVAAFGVMIEESRVTIEALSDLNPSIVEAWQEAQGETVDEEEDQLESALRAKHAGSLKRLLIEEDGNVSAVARRLNKSRPSVYRMMTRLGVSLDDLRQKS